MLDDTGTPITELPTGYGSAPIGVAASPYGATVYVTLQGVGELRRYDATTRALTALSPWGHGLGRSRFLATAPGSW